MSTSQETGEIFTALCNAQSEIHNVGKSKQAYGYKYADLAACLDAVREPLFKNGLAIAQFAAIEDGRDGLVTLLTHTSGQWIRGFFPLEAVQLAKANSSQQMGAAITYARRYGLAAMVGLAQDDDDAASTKSAPPKAQKISKPQVDQLMQAIGMAEANADKVREYYGVQSLADMTQQQFSQAMDGLKKKAQAKEAQT